MQSTRSVITPCHQTVLLTSVDIRDAYLHGPVFSAHQCFLHFPVGTTHFQFVVLSYGLLSAPWLFTKTLAPVLALQCSFGIHIEGYLDDLLLKEKSAQALLNNSALTVQRLQGFSWIPNLQKLLLELTHHLEYLSLVLDVAQARVFLPQEKSQIYPTQTHALQFRSCSPLLLHESFGSDGTLFWGSPIWPVLLQTPTT